MKRFVMFLILAAFFGMLLGYCTVGWADENYTITVTDKQVKGLDWAKDKYNAENATVEGFVKLSKKEYLERAIRGACDSWYQSRLQEKAAAVTKDYPTTEKFDLKDVQPSEVTGGTLTK